MIDTDDIDDVQAALIDRRIGHAFAFARVAVDDPAIMDVFEDGSDLDIKDIVPSPRIPEHAFIVEGNTQTGESVKVAVGVCVCNANHDVAKGKFWLRAGERWVCADCGRVYVFNGERISITEGADAMTGS